MGLRGHAHPERYGELIGINQLTEWGLLMSPIVLTSSLQIGKAYDATVRWIAGRDRTGAGEVMPVVSECDDSWLSDVLSFPLSDDDVAAALSGAASGPVAEGCVGAGTGMACFDFKGGIGTASRRLPADAGGFTVGVLVLTNYGDREFLQIDGVHVGEAVTDLMPTITRTVRASWSSQRMRRCCRTSSAAWRSAGAWDSRDRLVRLERERRADDRVLHREPPVHTAARSRTSAR